MKIEVTAADIAAGLQMSRSSCPVALAVRRATEQAWYVTHECYYRWTSESCWAWEKRPLSPRVRQFIDDFDLGIAVQPFAFEF